MSVEERNMLSVAFKNVIASKRTAWRTVVSVQNNPRYLLYQGSLLEYKTKLENMLKEQCEAIIAMI